MPKNQMFSYEELVISDHVSIKAAMEVLDRLGSQILIVVDKNKKLLVKAGESPELSNVDSGAADAASQASSSAIDTATISIEEQIRSTQPGSVEAAELIAKAKRSNPNFIPPAGY